MWCFTRNVMPDDLCIDCSVPVYFGLRSKINTIFIYDGALSLSQFSQQYTPTCCTMNKSFHLNINTHKLHVSYQPSHIQFDILDNHNNRSNSAVFYDSTLPDMVKEECQYVSDLYEFLQAKNPEEIKIEQQYIKFNVVRIKKERWFSLQLQKANTENQAFPQDYKPSMKGQPFLQQQNEKLKQQIQNLKLKNKYLQSELQRKDRFDYNRMKQYQDNNMEITQYQKQTFKKIKKNDNLSLSTKMKNTQNENSRLRGSNVKQMYFSPNSKCQGYSKYHIKDNIITKIDKQMGILVFNEQINMKQKKMFSVQLQKDFHKKWIIIGLMTQQHINRPYCYCFKNTVCFSGSLGLIFNELDAIDVGVNPKKGDTISLVVYQKGKLQWVMNDRIIFRMKLTNEMFRQPLYPYLMLSSQNDSVIINHETK